MKQPGNYAKLKEKIHPVTSRPFSLIALLYGRSGTGKTHLAATFPKPALLIDVKEGGTDTIRDEQEIDVIEVDTWEEMLGVYWMLKMEDSPQEYQTLVVDQLTKLQDLAMAQALSEAGKDPDAPLSMRDWGTTSGIMKSLLFDLVAYCKQKRIHLVFIAHDRTTNRDEGDDEAIDPSVGARLMPSLATAVNGAVDLIGCTFIREDFVGPLKEREVEYCLRVGPNGVYTTKLRRPSTLGEIPEYLVDPSFEKLAEMVRPKPQTVKRRKVKK